MKYKITSIDFKFTDSPDIHAYVSLTVNYLIKIDNVVIKTNRQGKYQVDFPNNCTVYSDIKSITPEMGSELAHPIIVSYCNEIESKR